MGGICSSRMGDLEARDTRQLDLIKKMKDENEARGRELQKERDEIHQLMNARQLKCAKQTLEYRTLTGTQPPRPTAFSKLTDVVLAQSDHLGNSRYYSRKEQHYGSWNFDGSSKRVKTVLDTFLALEWQRRMRKVERLLKHMPVVTEAVVARPAQLAAGELERLTG